MILPALPRIQSELPLRIINRKLCLFIATLTYTATVSKRDWGSKAHQITGLAENNTAYLYLCQEILISIFRLVAPCRLVAALFEI
jgi:hypothetical protein